jgi:hypothetical protein
MKNTDLNISASSFGRTYVRDVETKILNPKSDDLLHHNVILQLIMHHLECEGLKGARRLLEKESNIQCKIIDN